jgi:hypothetical protein
LKDIASGVTRHTRYDETVRNFTEEQFKKYFPNFSGTEIAAEKWHSFGKNEYWESYAFEPIQFNTAIIYDPLFFHQMAWESGSPEQTEYVLNGFLDSPIVKFPFWESKQSEQPATTKPLSPMDI